MRKEHIDQDKWDGSFAEWSNISSIQVTNPLTLSIEFNDTDALAQFIENANTKLEEFKENVGW